MNIKKILSVLLGILVLVSFVMLIVEASERISYSILLQPYYSIPIIIIGSLLGIKAYSIEEKRKKEKHSIELSKETIDDKTHVIDILYGIAYTIIALIVAIFLTQGMIFWGPFLIGPVVAIGYFTGSTISKSIRKKNNSK